MHFSVYLCIYLYLCSCTCMYVCLYLCICMCICVCVCVWVRVCVHVCVYACVRAYISLCAITIFSSQEHKILEILLYVCQESMKWWRRWSRCQTRRMTSSSPCMATPSQLSWLQDKRCSRSPPDYRYMSLASMKNILCASLFDDYPLYILCHIPWLSCVHPVWCFFIILCVSGICE